MRKDMTIWHTVAMLGFFDSEDTKPTTRAAIAVIGLSDDEKIARAEDKRKHRAQRNQKNRRLKND